MPAIAHTGITSLSRITALAVMTKRMGCQSGIPLRSDGALSSIAGYEAMNIIRKGQIRWLPKGDVVGQRLFIEGIFGIAA